MTNDFVVKLRFDAKNRSYAAASCTVIFGLAVKKKKKKYMALKEIVEKEEGRNILLI